MNTNGGLGRCLSFINCQLRPSERKAGGREPRPVRAVTISRQAGCGAMEVATKLAARLQAETPLDQPQWTVFDRNLMEQVLADHNLPARLAKFLPEDRITYLQDIADELFGLRPDSWTSADAAGLPIPAEMQGRSLAPLLLAELGNAILIGRAGNIITARLPHVLHVRLVAPLDQRITRIRAVLQKTEVQGRRFCEQEDAARERYVKKYFKADVTDALQYHLVINTGLNSLEEAARLIAEAVRGPANPPPAPVRRAITPMVSAVD